MNFYGERQLLLSIYILNWLGVRVVFTERRFSTSLGLVWYGSRIKFLLKFFLKFLLGSFLREDVSIHRTNFKYCGKSPKIRFLCYFHTV